MLYKKSQSPVLDEKLFKKPSAEYRGAPFWAWNDNLDRDELLWQIEKLKEMGLGGFHMHTRSGMATPYLSDEYMSLIRACVDKAKKEDMLAWLYDEDRWPSGAAGGIVTKNKNFRTKYLRLTRSRDEEIIGSRSFSNYIGLAQGQTPDTAVSPATGYLEGKPYLLAVYDIVLGSDGTLKSVRLIGPDDEAEGDKWYAYVHVERDSGWYNGQAYLDTLSDEAVAEFLRVTGDAYVKCAKDEFDKTVPAIFTDESQFRGIDRAAFSTDRESDRLCCWTTDLPVTFRKAYGYDLVEKIPEIFWNLEADRPSFARYHFHDHVAERFAHAFFDQYGAFCARNGISMTGHVMAETTLESQSQRVGETMRCYRGMQLPGIDMLCNLVELSTAKQTESAVHQYGREGMTSELYGVTGWDFDFRGHKFQGDWQAALGVTVRVPHLAWYSMKGSAKRDYPASINYQSAWYDQYPYVEDHFARLNTVLTRGRPVVKVGVIHPVESMWLQYGPRDRTDTICQQLENNFSNTINWLLRGTVDFDFICESTLPSLYKNSGDGLLHIGQMAYEAVVVPGLLTMRASTLDALKEFSKNGGKVIFLGECPELVDAKPSDAVKELYGSALKPAFTSNGLLSVLKEQRDISLKLSNGSTPTKFIYQKRSDGDYEWIFLARCEQVAVRSHRRSRPPVWPDALILTVPGHKKITVYDTLTGEKHSVRSRFDGDLTRFNYDLYEQDSLLFRLEDSEEECAGEQQTSCRKPDRILDFKEPVPYERSEPNVAVLDMAQYSEDGKSWKPVEEMLRIDKKLRSEYKYPDATGGDIQPWLLTGETIEHFPYLRFTFESEISCPVSLAFEEADAVWLNKKSQKVCREGYFTDKHVFTMPLDPLSVGENELIVRVPIGKRLSLENMFLLGDFDVETAGCGFCIKKPGKTISFGSVLHQGLPFYGANLTYKLAIDVEASDIEIESTLYRGALLSVKLDGKEAGRIAYAPYKLMIRGVAAGRHEVELTCHLTRVNCFGGLHNCTDEDWIGPSYWYTDGADWSYEYKLLDQGIMKSPVIRVFHTGN